MMIQDMKNGNGMKAVYRNKFKGLRVKIRHQADFTMGLTIATEIHLLNIRL